MCKCVIINWVTKEISLGRVISVLAVLGVDADDALGEVAVDAEHCLSF